MIIKAIQHVYDVVRDNYRTRIYRTFQDPVTHKEITRCEVYTVKGIIDEVPDKGSNIDKKV